MFDADNEVVKRTIGDKRAALLRARGCEVTQSQVVGPASVLARTLDRGTKRLLDLRGGTSLSSGDGHPDWVPEGFTHYVDFVRAFNELDCAWTAADGIVDITTLVGADPNTVNGWGATEYDPEKLTADGYGGGSAIAVIGALRSKVFGASGSTLQFKFKQHAAGTTGNIVFVSADGTNAVELDFDGGSQSNNQFYSWTGSLAEEYGAVINVLEGTALNAFALTVVPQSRFEVAVNGDDDIAGVIDDTDWPDAEPPVALLLDFATTLQSIGVRDALPSTEGLSELSRVWDSIPEWVPEGVTHYVDFVRAFQELDCAWTYQAGIVDIATLVGADPNTNNWSGPSDYDPANLTAEGYVDASGRVAAIGDLRSKFLGGCALVTRWNSPAGPTAFGGLIGTSSADGFFAVEFYPDGRSFFGEAYQGDYGAEIASIINHSGNFSTNNAVALVLAEGRAEFAVNGSDVSETAITEAERPASLVTLYFITGAGGSALESIGALDLPASAAPLSALSETGVTNTAPHTFEVVEWDNNVTPTGDFAGTVPADQTGSSGTCIGNVAASDDEGNPLAFTLTDDDGGNFQMPPGPEVQVWYGSDPLSIGTHNFTLRATDPGGLFVEQEFEIEVVAA